ncbi:hypothetical protein BC830DRAFT_1158802 [Chytriomyces sp. MP71]|nr:hypothetical protein BC830DRAFT_1158802 [Chytriomyces sp. MP71]
MKVVASGNLCLFLMGFTIILPKCALKPSNLKSPHFLAPPNFFTSIWIASTLILPLFPAMSFQPIELQTACGPAFSNDRDAFLRFLSSSDHAIGMPPQPQQAPQHTIACTDQYVQPAMSLTDMLLSPMFHLQQPTMISSAFTSFSVSDRTYSNGDTFKCHHTSTLPSPPAFHASTGYETSHATNPSSVGLLPAKEASSSSLLSTLKITDASVSPPPRPLAASPQAQRKQTNSKKRFVCSTCGATAFRKQDMERHETVHGGVRAHICPVDGCGKSFTRKDAMARHLKSASVHRSFYKFAK